jgi:hypothetical protein
VCNPALQYMAYEWLTQRASEVKRRRAGASKRVALGSGEVFLLGEGRQLGSALAGWLAGWLAAGRCACHYSLWRRHPSTPAMSQVLPPRLWPRW